MIENLMDDGENCAVRCFLMAYGGLNSISVKEMKAHMKASGFPYWPEWADTPDAQGHLTKLGAQNWLRHLFALEGAES